MTCWRGGESVCGGCEVDGAEEESLADCHGGMNVNV